jgi:hypothetical protein
MPDDSPLPMWIKTIGGDVRCVAVNRFQAINQKGDKP